MASEYEPWVKCERCGESHAYGQDCPREDSDTDDLASEYGEARYQKRPGSQSDHCCFDFTVVDTTKPVMLPGGSHYEDSNGPQYEQVCECFCEEDADRIIACVNALAGYDPEQVRRELGRIAALEAKLAEAHDALAECQSINADRQRIIDHNQARHAAAERLAEAVEHWSEGSQHPGSIKYLVKEIDRRVKAMLAALAAYRKGVE